VGNRQRVLISDLAGKSNILHKAEELKVDLKKKPKVVHQLLKTIKELENQGFEFEGAEGSFELLMRELLESKKRYFTLRGFRVLDIKTAGDEIAHSEATIELEVDGCLEHTAAHGHGPVNALDNALRKALERFYPQLREMQLIDYKVRVLPSNRGTASQVRVLIESSDMTEKWGTVGVSENIIQASWMALVDSITYKLMKDGVKPTTHKL
jgi:2-isopropylmalate synthase